MKKTQRMITLQLSSKDLPEIKDWVVGGKCELGLNIEVTGLRKPEGYEVASPDGSVPKGVIMATVKVLAMETCDEDDTEADATDDTDSPDVADTYAATYADKRSSANKKNG